MDKGPWFAVYWKNSGWVVTSEDFTHDVYLSIHGDLHESAKRRPNKKQYALWLAKTLNEAAKAVAIKFLKR